jgi:hypothetical protein
MAFGTGTISSIGGAVSDLFAAEGHRSKAQGLRIEGGNYDLASRYATENEKFTEVSTAVKQAQLDRENFKVLGGQQADVAGAGFAASGTALDLLRDSAAQGALTKAIGAEQGLITEEGYKVQSETYSSMGKAARIAADAEEEAATGSTISAVFKGAAAVASIFAAPATGGLSLAGLGSMFMGGGSPSGYGSGG